MEFLTEDDRENLIIAYKHLHEENRLRGHAIWVGNSILITGSLIIAFQSYPHTFPVPLVSLALVAISAILHLTGQKITAITYKRMKQIETQLGITEPAEMYESEIQGKWWHVARINSPYVLFILLIGVYIFLQFNNAYLLLTTYLTGFIILLIKEVNAHLARSIEESQKRKT